MEAGIEARYHAVLSPGYSFMGFLLALLSSAGDVLQITQGVPAATVNVLMGVALFIVLAQRRPRS